MQSREIWIVYDGDCPYCQGYVEFVRLRDTVGQVHLVDARTRHPIVDEVRRLGLNLDEGMVLKVGETHFFGPEVLTQLAMMSSESGFLNRFIAWVFADAARAKVLYPALRLGRNLTLWILGRRRIS